MRGDELLQLDLVGVKVCDGIVAVVETSRRDNQASAEHGRPAFAAADHEPGSVGTKGRGAAV